MSEERNEYIKKQWIIHGLIIQMIVLFILLLLPVLNVNYPIIAGYPFYTFYTFFVLPIIGLFNVAIWFKKLVRLDREQIRRGEEVWR